MGYRPTQPLPALVEAFLRDTDVYLFGPIGVGKTTFVDGLRQHVKVNYISMGDISRRALLGQDPHSVFTERKEGRIPLEAVQTIIAPYLSPDSPYILDGVPRHPDEAEWIKEHIAKRPYKAVALTLAASDTVLFERIRQRALRGDRPETPERITRRLEVYKRNRETVLDILEPVINKNIVINTTHFSPDGVLETFCATIAKEFA